MIFNDAFSGVSPIMKLATIEAATAIKEHLNENGIYMYNAIGVVLGEGSEFIKALLATNKRVFRHVYVMFTNPEDREGTTKGNYMIIASDQELDPPDRIRCNISRFDKFLRDL